MSSQSEDLQAVLKNMREYETSLKKTLAPLFAELQEATKVAREFQAQVAPFLRALDARLKAFAEAASVFTDADFLEKFGYNWLVFLPAGTLLEYYMMYKLNRVERIRAQLKAAVREESKALLQSYAKSPTFGKRLEIVGPAFEAHLRGEYSLSVPALLSQVEGVVWDIAAHLGFPRRLEIDTPKGTRMLLSLTFMIDNTPVGESFFPTVTRFLKTKIFTGSFRHGILHGEILDFATEDNSADLILLTRVLYEKCEGLGI